MRRKKRYQNKDTPIPGSCQLIKVNFKDEERCTCADSECVKPFETSLGKNLVYERVPLPAGSRSELREQGSARLLPTVVVTCPKSRTV